LGRYHFYDEISSFIDEAILAHPLKTRAIAEARIKTDSIDSNTLAHLLRSDLIPGAYTPSFETRDLRNFPRFRMALVKVRKIEPKQMPKNAIIKRG